MHTDINLPDKIKEAMDEQGNRPGDDAKITIDLSLGIGFQKVTKSAPKKRGGFFSTLFRCGQKDEVNQEVLNKFELNTRIKLLPMSVAPGMKIKKYLGIVDVHVIRVVRFLGQTDQVPLIIEQIIEETNEIAKARVESLGGNCLLSMRTDINTID